MERIPGKLKPESARSKTRRRQCSRIIRFLYAFLARLRNENSDLVSYCNLFNPHASVYLYRRQGQKFHPTWRLRLGLGFSMCLELDSITALVYFHKTFGRVNDPFLQTAFWLVPRRLDPGMLEVGVLVSKVHHALSRD
jgi:hypothetical protein